MSYGSNIFLCLRNLLTPLGAIGIFLSGFFYAYSFTAGPATAILLTLAKQQNIITAVLVGGLGALSGDIIIYLFVKHSFIVEIERLKNEQIIVLIGKTLRAVFGPLYECVLPITAGFLIASPLPTEIGIALITSMKKMSVKKFIFIVYILHTAGIFFILLIGKSL